MIVLGRSVNNRGKTGVQVRLYTDKPFRPREDGVPRDDFEWEALDDSQGPGDAGLSI